MWDHLHILCEHKLDIDTPFTNTNESQDDIIERIHNTQGSVKHKHYGKLIIELIKEWVKLKDSSIKEYLLDQHSFLGKLLGSPRESRETQGPWLEGCSLHSGMTVVLINAQLVESSVFGLWIVCKVFVSFA